MNMDILKLGIGVAILMLLNILFGVTSASFKQDFSKVKLIKGISKSALLVIGFAGVVFVGNITSDILTVDLVGMPFNLLTLAREAALIGYIYYGKDIIEKITSIMNVPKIHTQAPQLATIDSSEKENEYGR